MSRLNDLGKRYMELGDEIKALTEQRKLVQQELGKIMPVGHKLGHAGSMYEWITYDRAATGWKVLYRQAYGMLPDTEQVILGEAELKAGKLTKHFKFSKIDP